MGWLNLSAVLVAEGVSKFVQGNTKKACVTLDRPKT